MRPAVSDPRRSQSEDDFPIPASVSVNGVELEVFEAGRQNAGKTVVLCHGWPEHAYSWRHLMPALVAAGYHVIAPNQRGYGNSSRPAEVADYDIEHLSGDLVPLLDHYGYEDATFVGHDWGAIVVWALNLLHPNRVKRVINRAPRIPSSTTTHFGSSATCIARTYPQQSLSQVWR